jgi:ribosomal protein L40E
MPGLHEPEEDKEESQVQECPRCDELNEPGASFCMRCGYALDQKTAGELEAEVGEATKESYAQTDPEDEEQMADLDTSDEVMDDPEVKAALLDEWRTNCGNG